jgi:S-adenosylmethionine synthetase
MSKNVNSSLSYSFNHANFISTMLKTVEVPFAGHPDKICDLVVDTILDEYLKRDPNSRVDIQALGSHGMMMIGGSVDSRADFDVSKMTKDVYNKIGYQDDIEPFVNIEQHSEESAHQIAKGGAHGTSIVYGYATRQTREFLPKATVYANAIAKRIDDLRSTDPRFSILLPDGKVQISMEGDHVESVSLSVQHADDVECRDVQTLLVESSVEPIIGKDSGARLFVNSAGKFCHGGFSVCGGASGRKMIADTYGGLLPHGGASLSGKDPRRPARCGHYMARHVAKNLVAKGVAGNVLVAAGYTIGHADPIFLQVTTGKGQDITDMVKAEYDFRPEAIVESLDLANPIYANVATYGQFGREGLPWEAIDKTSKNV